MKKIITKHGEEKVNKTILKIGLFLVFAGILFFILGALAGYTPYESYENGYHYRDEVAIIAISFIWNGLPLVMWWGGNKLRNKRGWTVNF
jgi:hypothetical protein